MPWNWRSVTNRACESFLPHSKHLLEWNSSFLSISLSISFDLFFNNSPPTPCRRRGGPSNSRTSSSSLSSQLSLVWTCGGKITGGARESDWRYREEWEQSKNWVSQERLELWTHARNTSISVGIRVCMYWCDTRISNPLLSSLQIALGEVRKRRVHEEVWPEEFWSMVTTTRQLWSQWQILFFWLLSTLALA